MGRSVSLSVLISTSLLSYIAAQVLLYCPRVYDPIIQKPHLILRVEPMLPARHDGQRRAVSFRKGRYGLNGG